MIERVRGRTQRMPRMRHTVTALNVRNIWATIGRIYETNVEPMQKLFSIDSLRMISKSWIIPMRIMTLNKYRGRYPKGYFQDLPWEIRNQAYQWLFRLCSKWDRDLPAWRFAILVGQAKRLALNPPTSAWGRSMLAKRGGKAVQRKYLLEGRHPT